MNIRDREDSERIRELREMQDTTENEIRNLMNDWILDRDLKSCRRLIDRLQDWKWREYMIGNRKLGMEMRQSREEWNRNYEDRLHHEEQLRQQYEQDLDG